MFNWGILIMSVVTLGFVLVVERSRSELFSKGVYYFYSIA